MYGCKKKGQKFPIDVQVLDASYSILPLVLTVNSQNINIFVNKKCYGCEESDVNSQFMYRYLILPLVLTANSQYINIVVNNKCYGW